MVSKEFPIRTINNKLNNNKIPTYFIRDLVKPQKGMPQREIDESWVIRKTISEEIGIISVMKGMLFVAIGKSSSCRQLDATYDIQIEVAERGGVIKCIDVLRYDKKALDDLTLKERLHCVTDAISLQLDILPRELEYVSDTELRRIRDYEDINSEYVIQEGKESFFEERFLVTYDDLKQELLRRDLKKADSIKDNPREIFSCDNEQKVFLAYSHFKFYENNPQILRSFLPCEEVKMLELDFLHKQVDALGSLSDKYRQVYQQQKEKEHQQWLVNRHLQKIREELNNGDGQKDEDGARRSV